MSEVVETRNIVAPHNASDEVKAQVLAAGGTVLPAPAKALRGAPDDSRAPIAPATTATTPVDGARAGHLSHLRGGCQHDDARKRLHITLNTAGGAMFATYCVGCGALGPAAKGRVPSLAQWNPPDEAKGSRAPQPFRPEPAQVEGPRPERWAQRATREELLDALDALDRTPPEGHRAVDASSPVRAEDAWSHR